MKASKKRMIKFREAHKRMMLKGKHKCVKHGHVGGEFETNGLGVGWTRCLRCGERYDIK